MKKIVLLTLLLVAFFALPALAAESYPVKPIQLVVPFPPGGGSDVTARIVAECVNKYLPHPLVVSNISGGTGSVGAKHVLRSKPDGYTLFWEHPTMSTQTASKVVKHSFRDFDMVCTGVRTTFMLVANKRLPVKTANELFEYMLAHPKQVRWPMSFGAMSHFSYLYLADGYKDGDKLEPKVVTNSGGKGRVVALIGDNADATCASISAVSPYVRSGDIVPLGVFSKERNPFMPEVPTLEEQGIHAIYNQIFTLFGPKGMPEEVKVVLRDAFKKGLNDPEAKEALGKQSCEPYYQTPDVGTKLWEIQEAKNIELVKKFKLIK